MQRSTGCCTPSGRWMPGSVMSMRSAASFAPEDDSVNAELRSLNRGFSLRLELVDPLADLALGGLGRGLQPGVVDLRQQAVLARHPAVAERLPVGLGLQRASFGLQRSEQFGDGAIERRGRKIFEFGNGVHECVSLKYNGRPCGRPSRKY